MYFPALVLGLRRFGCWLVYDLFQLALWVALGLRPLGSLRSALGGGGAQGAGHQQGPAIWPRRGPGGSQRKGHVPVAAA